MKDSSAFLRPRRYISIFTTLLSCETVVLMSDWQSTPYVERHKEFLEKLVATLIDCTFESVSRENPVLRWREPAYLQDIINFNLQEDPKSQDNLLEIANNISKYSVKTGHPYFMNQLFSG